MSSFWQDLYVLSVHGKQGHFPVKHIPGEEVYMPQVIQAMKYIKQI